MRRYSLGLGWIDDLPAGGNTPHPGTGWLPAGGKSRTGSPPLPIPEKCAHMLLLSACR